MMLRATALLAFAALLSFTAVRPAAADEPDPRQVAEDFFDALNDGDVAAATALFSEDAYFTEITTLTSDSFAAIGRDAFAFILEEAVAAGEHASPRGFTVDGDQVSTTVEWTGGDAGPAGVERYLENVTLTIGEDGLISRVRAAYVEFDPQTRQYLEYIDAQDGEEGGAEEPGSVTLVDLAPEPGGNQPGLAFVFEIQEGVTFVGIEVAAGPLNLPQPAHLHSGTCATPGQIIYPLASVFNGASFTLLSATPDDLTGLILNVHRSEAAITEYVSCGDVQATEEAPVPPPVPAPQPPRPAPITAPDTGIGSTAPQRGLAGALWLGAAAATIGSACVASGFKLRGHVRHR
jgi:ketosteroid isomerase-like protein